MKKIMISLLMVAATLNAMAVTYSGKVKVTLKSSDAKACAAIVATSNDLNDGLNPEYYAELNEEGKEVLLYVQYGTTRYAHFGSSETTMRNMPLVMKANSATDYTLKFASMEGTIDIYDKKLGVHIDKSQNYDFSIEASERDANNIVADRFVINYTYVTMSGDFDNVGGSWSYLATPFTHDGANATKELDLDADTWYSFQLDVNGAIGADDFDFDSSNKSHVVPTTGYVEKLSLHTEYAGTYTFTWEYATNTLTIGFPAAPAPTCTTVREELVVDRYYTICLAKAVTAANGASFWNMSKRGTGVAYLEEAELPLVAGRPYIFQAEATELCVELSGDDAAVGTNGALVGTFAAMDQAALDAVATTSDIYLLYNNELVKVNGQSGNSLAANRAYVVYNELVVENPTPAPGRRVRAIPMQEQTATGVENINASEVATKFVENGQIYIRRGNEVFNLQGQVVK